MNVKNGPTMESNNETNENAPAAEEQSATNREAAKYRRQLREVETERDTLRSQLTDLAREHIESTLPRGLNPEIFWKLAPETDEFMKEGQINHDFVKSEVSRLSRELNIGHGPIVSAQKGMEHDQYESKNSFDKAFAPRQDN